MVRDGRSPHTHLFLRSNKQDDCGTVLHRASLLSSHLHRESCALPALDPRSAFGIEAIPAHGDAGSESGTTRIPTNRKPAPWPPTVGSETDEVRREAVKCPSWVVCHERRMSYLRRATVREMKEGPSSSVIRSRSQATASCCGQKPWW